MNWIVPGKLLALASPFVQRQLPDGYKVALPSDLIEPFKQKGITHIVRLCERLYDERAFTRAGFRHTELFFDDGSCPPMRIRDTFLRMLNGPDVIALHCRAGIGRTYFWFSEALTHRGTLAAVYLITKYGFSGDEAIAWVRICRKGSIMGPQQRYVIQQASGQRPRGLTTSLQKTGNGKLAKPSVKQQVRRTQSKSCHN
jgi:cell division cycle 14